MQHTQELEKVAINDVLRLRLKPPDGMSLLT